MIEWCSSPALRSRCRAGLNKGEAGHKLTRTVFFHERGEILRHVSPQLWEHINLTGTYDWSRQDLPPSGAFRLLRRSTNEVRVAA